MTTALMKQVLDLTAAPGGSRAGVYGPPSRLGAAELEQVASMSGSPEARAQAATTFDCPTCGALYEVRVQHFSLRDKGQAGCFVCRQVIVQWDSAHVPFFTLVKKPNQRSG